MRKYIQRTIYLKRLNYIITPDKDVTETLTQNKKIKKKDVTETT